LVADTSRGAALGADRHELVGRARVALTITALGHVAGAHSGPAEVRALPVHRTGRRGPSALLFRVTRARGRSAHGPRRSENIGRADVRRAVAALGHVAPTARDATDVRPLRVDRTVGAHPGTGLREVARPGGATTSNSTRHEPAVATTAVAVHVRTGIAVLTRGGV
jgi:hypothetical protein